MSGFEPYLNETDEQEIGNLKVENRIDRVSINGDLDITLDQVGLANARTLKALIDTIVISLENQVLPATLTALPIKTVKNPF